MKWTPDMKRIARTTIRACDTLAAGYQNAAASLGVTATSVRLQHERGGLGEGVGPAVRPTAPKDAIARLRLETEIATLKKANKRLVRDARDRADELAIFTDLSNVGPIAPLAAPSTIGAKQRKGVPVMLCSDWHVEETVDPGAVSGLNEYNLEIADRCIDRLADGYEWFLRDSRYDCRAGVVWLGGDLMTGYIHDELVEGNALSPPETVVWLLERIERMLRRIAATTTLERIIVPCNSGNHGRTTDKIRVATREANSFEWILYQTLAARLADDPRFEFQIARGEWLYLDVLGHTLAFAHGDSFRYAGGVGGVSIPLRRGVNEIRKHRPVHHFSVGHFHTRQDFGDISINGSMIGVSPYSLRIHAPPEPRQQSWFLVDAERGKCLSAPVWL